jgi:hypothetical protein
VLFDRSALGLGIDDAIFTCHVRETLALQPDNTPMDHASRLAWNTKIQTFLTAVATAISNKYRWRSCRYYDVPDAAPHKPVFIEEILAPASFTMGATQTNASQISCSVTFRTDTRRQWGRFYLPGLSQAFLVDTTGRIGSSQVDTICNAARALTDRSNTSLAHPTLTVWSKVQGTRHDPQYVEVDDVPDVIRSRRLNFPVYKKIVAAG